MGGRGLIPVGVDLDGGDRLADTLREAAAGLPDALDGAALAAGRAVVHGAVIPVKTGNLKAHGVTLEASPGGSFNIVVGGRQAPYGPIVHARNPFITRSLDARTAEVADLYTQAAQDYLSDTIQGA